MKFHLALIIIFPLVLSACIGDERNVPSSYIQQEDMKKILYELYVADAYNAERIYRDQTLQLQSENVTYYKKILGNYGVDQKNFFSSMEYYKAHPKIFQELADSLNNYAKRMGDVNIPHPENTNNGHHFRHIRKPAGNR